MGFISDIAGRLTTRPNPTADLYFRFACQDLLDRGEVMERSPNVFESRNHLIVIRHDQGLAAGFEHKRLIYLIDDDLYAGGTPFGYQAKLRLVERPAALRLEARAHRILVTSEVLQTAMRSRHPTKPISLIGPAWPEINLSAPAASDASFRVGLLMGASHVLDARPLLSPLAALLRSFPDMRLTVSANLKPPPVWAQNHQISMIPSLSWPQYRAWMKGQRFAVLLYPLMSGAAFNHARSDNKLGEAAQFGAALFASSCWGPAVQEQNKGRCLTLDNDPDSWVAALAQYRRTPELAATLAKQNHHALTTADRLGHLREFWQTILAET